MLNIEIIAVGRLRSGAYFDLWNEYAGRLTGWQMRLHEIDDRKPAMVETSLLEKMEMCRFNFVLDERGKPLSSAAFSNQIQTLEQGAGGPVGFVLGGADGHSDVLRKKADFLLSFGVQTWPHMLARVMLAEQIYRARQIAIGHPYHRA